MRMSGTELKFTKRTASAANDNIWKIKLHNLCVYREYHPWLFSTRKKEEIWLIPMTKTLIPTEKSDGKSHNTKNASKKFDYIAIADRLRTVSWINYSYQINVVNRFTGRTVPIS